jgi:hypothetical protein
MVTVPALYNWWIVMITGLFLKYIIQMVLAAETNGVAELAIVVSL